MAFLPRSKYVNMAVGSALGGSIDGVLKGVYSKDPAYWTGKFPFISLIEPLPPLNEWLVLFSSVGVSLIGRFLRKPTIAEIGDYMTVYSVGMLTETTIEKARRMIATQSIVAPTVVGVTPIPAPAPAPRAAREAPVF